MSLARLLHAALRSRVKRGPYLIGGVGMSAALAHELAVQVWYSTSSGQYTSHHVVQLTFTSPVLLAAKFICYHIHATAVWQSIAHHTTRSALHKGRLTSVPMPDAPTAPHKHHTRAHGAPGARFRRCSGLLPAGGEPLPAARVGDVPAAVGAGAAACSQHLHFSAHPMRYLLGRVGASGG